MLINNEIKVQCHHMNTNNSNSLLLCYFGAFYMNETTMFFATVNLSNCSLPYVLLIYLIVPANSNYKRSIGIFVNGFLSVSRNL